jgi:L-histidine Nalpha-methyltransferase
VSKPVGNPGELDLRFTVESHLDRVSLAEEAADEVRAGLTSEQKRLPAKYFYDEHGSLLFEQITGLPEYYPTRTELSILRANADPLIVDGRYEELVEIGSGAATKTRTLLDAMERAGTLRRYVPFDVSEEMLRTSSHELLARYPRLSVHGVVGDFQRHLSRIPQAAGRRLVIFLGSTIGNLEVEERLGLLGATQGLLQPGDAFLLGIDLVKDIGVIEAAYNDAAGVTAEFNRNMLRVINTQFDGDFDPDAFRHHAFYNRDEDRIEMHLIPDEEQGVTLRALNLDLRVRAGESIRTEISCKFTREGVAAMLEAAGLRLASWLTDADALFGLALATTAES